MGRSATAAAPIRVGLAGFGAIGRTIASALDAGIDGVELAAVAVRDPATAGERVAHLSRTPELTTVGDLARHCDLVVECAPAALLPAIAEPALSAGKTLVVLSCGALLTNMHLVDLARAHGGRIVVPSGALLGLDAVVAAAEGTIHSVTMVTRKPPLGLAGAPYLEEHGIDMGAVTEPTRVFAGTAREAAAGFPANLNVAVALSLAGVGPDATRLEIWADPTVTRNTHQVIVDADAARLSVTIENVPSENPKTGRITALSVIAALRKLRAPLAVGT